MISALCWSFIHAAAAEPESSRWLDDTFFQDGKYKVVIVVLSIIFLGIMAFVALLERRVGRLEKQWKNKEKGQNG